MKYLVQFSRPALEIAEIEVEAKSADDASTIAYDALKGKKDAQVKAVRMEFRPDEEMLWEEDSTEIC